MEKDLRCNAFFSDNERYADIINGIGCDGIPFVQGKDLQELDARVSIGGLSGYKTGKRGRSRKPFYRDLVRKTPFGINFAIVGIENQEKIDYAMPLRIMCYDAGEYERQASIIRKKVRKTATGLSSGEYLYGFRKNSRLFSTVTFVLYYGEEDWDGAKDIHGILNFTDIPECLRDKISNYQLHVIEVRKLKDTSVFKTDVRQVFDFIRFSKDKKKLKELIETDTSYQFLDEDACDMVTTYVGDEKMFKWKEKHKKGGKINMCQGLREWLEDEREEGREEGSNRMGKLIILLSEQSRNEDLLKAAQDARYREVLFKELNI